MQGTRNPYINDDGKPTLKKSVVAFIDILGFKDLSKGVANQADSGELLQTVHSALKEARQHIDPDTSKTIGEQYLGQDFSAISAFTDNIVIGHPIDTDGEMELGSIFDDLSRFQLKMALKGYFVRGAIAVGDLYMDEFVVFGGGLVEAYEGESILAFNPRIVLTRSAMEFVDLHLLYYGSMPHAPQNIDLLKDSDDNYFVSYLEAVIGADDGQIDSLSLNAHKERIESKLIEYRKQPKIWNKYFWAATYHNYFCALRPATTTFRVNTSDLTIRPVKIIPND
ncbi:MAG TPA: hypothetical protein PLN21_06620 [Gemmatales bacterium]|nr:hypothetical protein [Gemmatales bacterium]